MKTNEKHKRALKGPERPDLNKLSGGLIRTTTSSPFPGRLTVAYKVSSLYTADAWDGRTRPYSGLVFDFDPIKTKIHHIKTFKSS